MGFKFGFIGLQSDGKEQKREGEPSSVTPEGRATFPQGTARTRNVSPPFMTEKLLLPIGF